MIECSKSIAKTLVKAFNQGVVPSKGLGVIAVGRDKEMDSIDSDLDGAAEGQGSFRFIVGRYGTGKSFMLGLIREHAMVNKRMVVMKADLSEFCLFSGTKKGQNLYRSLIAGMSVNGKQGGAMETVLKRWVERLKEGMAARNGTDVSSISAGEVVREIKRLTQDMADMPLYSIFVTMVGRYYMQLGGSDQSALTWLKGEYEQRSLAKQDLGVGTIIDDSNWFDFIRIWSEFVRFAGYTGLVVLFDEAVSIYKISNSRSREKNYERLLNMYNDIVQGFDVHIAVYVCGTPDLIENEVRGIKSYAALYTRVSQGMFVGGHANPRGVLMYLRVLSREEVVILLSRLRDLYSIANDCGPVVSDEHIGMYMNRCFRNLGIDEAITPRTVSREFISVMDILHTDQSLSFESVVADVRPRPDRGHDDETFPERPRLEI